MMNDAGRLAIALAVAVALLPRIGAAQGVNPPPAAQNPSPMVETTRAHERLTEGWPATGTRSSFVGPLGKAVALWIAPRTHCADVTLIVHFLGAPWLPMRAASALGDNMMVAVVNVGAGSGIYDRTFSDPAVFDSLLANIKRAIPIAECGPVIIKSVTLSGFSAGHGAVRAILRDDRHFAMVAAILLLDGMHTSYLPQGSLLATGGTLDTTNLVQFVRFAQAAMRGEKRFLVTHSEIFPGSFASTTETADYLLRTLGLARTPVLRWGPRGMQQLSEVRSGGFALMGFAGNAGPDHIDQLHGMPEFLALLLHQ
jgi:hypothetical protein